jgi:hypothetical protein
MTCPLCRQRKARRDCPALGQTICSVCCGTKRLVEIACPSSCPHLAAAREHPAAVVKRQQEQDVARILPSIERLTERQYQLFFVFQTAIAQYTPEGLARLLDEDVAEAARTVAATLETASRGVIYEHSAQSLPAQRLASNLTAVLAELRSHGAKVYDGEAAIVLRAIAQGARDVRDAGGGPTDYLELNARLLHANRGGAQPAADAAPAPQSTLILP